MYENEGEGEGGDGVSRACVRVAVRAYTFLTEAMAGVADAPPSSA